MSAEIKYIETPHPITGVINSKLGTWLFLATEVMLFGGLFSAYIILRAGAPSWPKADTILNVPLATINTMVLIFSSVTMVMAWASLKMNNLGRFRLFLGLTLLCAVIFLIIKFFEYDAKFHHGFFPKTNNFFAVYFTMTGLHALHIIGGIVVNGYFLLVSGREWKNRPIMFTNRIENAGLYWHFVDLVWIFLFPTIYLV